MFSHFSFELNPDLIKFLINDSFCKGCSVIDLVVKDRISLFVELVDSLYLLVQFDVIFFQSF